MMKSFLSEFAATHCLTSREEEVLTELLKRQNSVKDIASTLDLSTNTVSNHFKKIFEKTKVNSRAEVLTAFIEFFFQKVRSCYHFHRRISLVVVDDNPKHLNLICHFFQKRGLHTHPFDNAAQALAALVRLRPDGLITDAAMPELSGFEILEQVRLLHPHLQAVALTSNGIGINRKAYSHIAIEAMDLGAVGVFDPMNLHGIYERLLHCLLHYRTDRADSFDTHNTRSNELIQLQKTMNIDTRHLGHGGLFIPLSVLKEAGLRSISDLKIGSRLEFRARINSMPKNENLIEATGRIAWLRTRPESGLEAGAGIIFIDIDDGYFDQVKNLARTLEIRSFVPRGAQLNK